MMYVQALGFSLLMLFSSSSWSQALGGDFSLTDQHGQRFELQQLRGKVVILFFGFTHCPSVCPDSLAKIKAALQHQPLEAATALLITVDPERDTVERLKAYIEPFGEQFMALTGTAQEVQHVLDAYQIRVKLMKKSVDDQNYRIDHTADSYVLDRAGKVAALIPYGLPTEHLQNIVQAQLAAPQQVIPVAQIENPAPTNWQVTDLAGQPQTLTAFKGQAVVINFWASWCPPCRSELPSLNQAHALLQEENIQMLAVNIGDKPEAAQRFLADYPIDFPVWLDENASSFKAWSIKGLPTTLLIDTTGTIKARIIGERNWTDQDLLDQMRALKAD